MNRKLGSLSLQTCLVSEHVARLATAAVCCCQVLLQKRIAIAAAAAAVQSIAQNTAEASRVVACSTSCCSSGMYRHSVTQQQVHRASCAYHSSSQPDITACAYLNLLQVNGRASRLPSPQLGSLSNCRSIMCQVCESCAACQTQSVPGRKQALKFYMACAGAACCDCQDA